MMAIASSVRAGKFYETTWDLLRWTYFRGMDDRKAMTALRAWAARHGLEVKEREGKTQLGGKLFSVRWVQLLRK
jgi:hypothetical protein